MPHLVFFSINGGNYGDRAFQPEEKFPGLQIRKHYLFDEK